LVYECQSDLGKALINQSRRRFGTFWRGLMNAAHTPQRGIMYFYLFRCSNA
jgi:hypothetical protein